MSTSTQELNTHDVLLDFGKHKGERLTRVPVGYVRWMLEAPHLSPEWRALAKSEYERRGTSLPTVELSGQAIDSASLQARKIWHETALHPEEGLYAWLMRITLEAVEKGERLPDGKIKYLAMEFLIEHGDEFPVLKSISC
jgi:hypothetical protein